MGVRRHDLKIAVVEPQCRVVLGQKRDDFSGDIARNGNDINCDDGKGVDHAFGIVPLPQKHFDAWRQVDVFVGKAIGEISVGTGIIWRQKSSCTATKPRKACGTRRLDAFKRHCEGQGRGQ